MKKLIAVGYWSTGPDDSRYPHPRELVNPKWEKRNRSKIIQYLRGGGTFCRYRGPSYCRFQCEEAAKNTFVMGTQDFTDGFWVWPEGLWHYVESHHVVLPREFISHMQEHNWDILLSIQKGGIPTTHQSKVESDDSYWIDWARDSLVGVNE